MPEAVIVSAVRTPVGRAPKGTLATTRPDDLAAIALSGALEQCPSLDRAEIDDIILGCAQPEGESGFNMARMTALRAGLPVNVPGVTVNRLCASGLEAIAQADMRIRVGGDRVVVAGGAESMSMIPMGGTKPSPNPWLAENYPASLLTMGLTAERVARHYNVSREDQDAFAFASHRRHLPRQQPAASPTNSSRQRDHCNAGRHKPANRRSAETVFAADEGPRADTSPDAWPNSSPSFTPRHRHRRQLLPDLDGAAASLMSADAARARNPTPGPPVAYAATGCLPEEMGVGPIHAIPKALKLAGLTLDDIDVIELNEAFAAQALAVIRLSASIPKKST